ncbi:hypothetical protein B0H13DRAFT_2377142 [Mycena leptocephala]|nr:hypothetical protein B0H13DRAFT_2377142 [Mycena leptocephala]
MRLSNVFLQPNLKPRRRSRRRSSNENDYARSTTTNGVTPRTTLPPHEQWDQCLREIARTVGEEVPSHFRIRVKTPNACALLSRLSIMKVAEDNGIPSFNLCCGHEHPYKTIHTVLPADIHPFLAQQLARVPAAESPFPSLNDAPSSKYPLVLPAQSFTSESVQQLARTRVMPDNILGYCRNPDPLPSQYFLSSDDEYFQVASMVTMGREKMKERLYYVVFADEGQRQYATHDGTPVVDLHLEGDFKATNKK